MNNSTIAFLDWGTTNFRAQFINQEGETIWQFEAEKGISRLEKSDMVQLLDDVASQCPVEKPTFYACGMIGSAIGWIDVPHRTCPANLQESTANIHWTKIGEYKVGIIPGLKVENEAGWDVMRGEEVQVFGFLQHTHQQNALVIAPGTHSKWTQVKNGEITSFFTAMTGEVYNLVSKQSLLKHHLGESVDCSEDFYRGVEAGLKEQGLGRLLFSVRGNSLFANLTNKQASDYVSGMFIASEIADGLREYSDSISSLAAENQPIALIGNPNLTKLYQAIFDKLEVKSECYDAQQINRTAFLAIDKIVGETND